MTAARRFSVNIGRAGYYDACWCRGACENPWDFGVRAAGFTVRGPQAMEALDSTPFPQRGHAAGETFALQLRGIELTELDRLRFVPFGDGASNCPDTPSPYAPPASAAPLLERTPRL